MVHSHQVQFRAIWSSQGLDKAWLLQTYLTYLEEFMASFSAVHVLCMPLEDWISFNTPLLHHEVVFGLFDGHVGPSLYSTERHGALWCGCCLFRFLEVISFTSGLFQSFFDDHLKYPALIDLSSFANRLMLATLK